MNKPDTTKPKRIQRKRERGWRMPEGAVYVGRPTKWGNPFPWQAQSNLFNTEREMRAEVVDMYRDWRSDSPDWVNEVRTELGGKSLACFCPLDQPCHADVLLEIANGK